MRIKVGIVTYISIEKAIGDSSPLIYSNTHLNSCETVPLNLKFKKSGKYVDRNARILL